MSADATLFDTKNFLIDHSTPPQFDLNKTILINQRVGKIISQLAFEGMR